MLDVDRDVTVLHEDPLDGVFPLTTVEHELPGLQVSLGRYVEAGRGEGGQGMVEEAAFRQGDAQGHGVSFRVEAGRAPFTPLG